MSFSVWQSEQNKKHPLLCQIITQIIANILTTVLLAIVALPWASRNIPPQAKASVTKISPDTSKITIQNGGLIPANKKFYATSQDTLTLIDIKSGQEYITIENTDNNKVKILQVDNLPKNVDVIIDFQSKDAVVLSNNPMRSDQK